MTVESLEFNLLDDESARQTIETVGNLAEQNGIEWALAGGLAVILYGSDRLTKDVGIIASGLLPLESQGLLKQGGARYDIATARQTVAVDWITRNDEARQFYQAALKDAARIKNVPVLTPEWLVILKYIAGRYKDQVDAVFLLSRSGLVNRSKIKELVTNTGGAGAWAVMKFGLQRWYDLADGKSEAEKDGYIDS